MTALSIRIEGGIGYAEHGRIQANVAGEKKPLRANGTVIFDIAKGTQAIAVEVTVRRPPWATSSAFPEDDLEVARFELVLSGKNYELKRPMHPRVLSAVGVARGGDGATLHLDYRFIDVTRYFLGGEVWEATHPGKDLSGLDPATNGTDPPAGGQRRPKSQSVCFLEWATGQECRVWCVAFPTSIGWTSPHDWFLFLIPKGPKTRSKSLLNYDFTSVKRYLLDPPRWAPKFVYAPIDEPKAKDATNLQSPDVHKFQIAEKHVSAALLSQVASAARPTVVVLPLPDDMGDQRYKPLRSGTLIERELSSLRTGLLASIQQAHLGGWAGAERFGIAGFSASALEAFYIARQVGRAGLPRQLALVGLIDPDQFTPATASAIATWEKEHPRRSVYLVCGDHHGKIVRAIAESGELLNFTPDDPDHFSVEGTAYARAVFLPPPEVSLWAALPLQELTEAEIAAGRAAKQRVQPSKGSTSDLVGWVRSKGRDRALLDLELEEVPMSKAVRAQLARLSTMELSGFIAWGAGLQTHDPRVPLRDPAALASWASDLRHQWAAASGDGISGILARWK